MSFFGQNFGWVWFKISQMRTGRSLNFCSCTTWSLDLDDLVRIDRAWLYKELKVSVLQANAKLV